MLRHLSKAKDLLFYFISQSYEKRPYFTLSGSAIVAVLAVIFGRRYKITIRPFNKIKNILNNIININSNNTTQISFDNKNNADDIYLAVTTNNLRKLRQILNTSTYDINKIYEKDGEVHSLLTLALVKDFMEIAVEVINHGADVSQQYKQINYFREELISPLELASKKLSLNLMKLIHQNDENQIQLVGGKALLKCLEYPSKNV